MTRHDPTVPEDRTTAEIRARYEAIRSELGSLSPADLEHNLPKLVKTLSDLSADAEETIRFLVGVSFTREYRPLDYKLDRIVLTDGGTQRVETLKSAVSQDHYYLRFSYPPDPHFDASALRGALLTSADRRLQMLEEDAPADSQIATIWKHLAGR